MPTERRMQLAYRWLLMQAVPGRAVHVGGNLALVPVAGRTRPGRLEHQDRPTRRRRLVVGPPRYHERVTHPELDGVLGAVGVADLDVEPAVEHEKELVRVIVDVPD